MTKREREIARQYEGAKRLQKGQVTKRYEASILSCFLCLALSIGTKIRSHETDL